ncbi:helix-hairpin-helix domain-containing protein [Desmospora profundinema]|uniref:Competence protein ComEA n=1 Tax=Desmospora profundinema TaxID=1571184 RepID=A0ABU1IJZ9_9BACL|nr:helix-hairpin-helix domain-containing protein [Desmospora profundinema]MDR6225107.1 competence protein ComEA [Desmospora profundinema]
MWVDEWSAREKKWATAAGVLALALVGMVLYSWWAGDDRKAESLPGPGTNEYQPLQPVENTADSDRKKEPAELVVDVKGAVKKPGVYRLPPGSRVEDAVKRAGGPAGKADMDRVNQAQPLTDGMALFVPAEGEEDVPLAGDSFPAAGGSGEAGAVNLNTATQEQLESLNGIGPAKAEAILRHREEHGPFSSVDELVQVPGIGEKTLEQLRDQVTVD